MNECIDKCEDLDKRIELCIKELSNLLQNKVKSTTKDDPNNSYPIEEGFDANLLHSTLETIAEMLQSDDCERLFESLYPIILCLKQNIHFTIPLNSNDSKTSSGNSSSFLTFQNVNLNSIWETICYRIEKLIINDMIKNGLDNELECERICLQIKFLLQLKDNQSLVIWRLYNTMRVCKLEAEIIDWNTREFDISLQRILSMISFDFKLYKSGYFAAYNMSYSELIIPYIQSVKSKLEAEVSSLNGSVSNLILLLKSMIKFDNELQEIRQDFPQFMESPEQNDIFDWKTIIENNSGINLFHRTIYDTINTKLRELNCFNTNCYNECETNDQNILCCVSQIFDNFENYELFIALDSFVTFLSYAVSANIVDFFIHHFNNGKYETISKKYTILNTIHFMKDKLEKMCVNVDKFEVISKNFIKAITSKHISILLMNRNSQYWLLYLKKLWTELFLKLKFVQNRQTIFMLVFSETVHNFSRIEISKSDAIFILENIIDLMFRYANSRSELLDKDKYNIHNSCWLILIKLMLQITDNENFISSLKKNKPLTESIANSSNSYWIQYIKPNLMQSLFWFNAKLCLDKHDISHNTIIRALLSNNCGFSSFILSQIDKNERSSAIVIASDIFQVIVLQNFRPQSLSSVILSLIESQNSWYEFDKSTILNTDSRIWWYSALESLIINEVNNQLKYNLKSLINQFRITSLVTDDILEIYKSNNLIFQNIDILVEQSFQILWNIIYDLILTLPASFITSLEILNHSLPESVNCVSQSVALNVLISSVAKQLQNCEFLNTNQDSIISFCQNIGNNFIEKLMDSNNNTNQCLLNAKNLLENKKITKNVLQIDEELEFDIISSSISDNPIYLPIFERLNSLIFKYRKVIDENLNIIRSKELNDNSLIIEFQDRNLCFEFIIQNIENYDYNQIINCINWDKLENEIKSKLDHFCINSLLLSINKN